jgi:hypothetical protein
MFDKIVSIFLLPFYGLWKYLINTVGLDKKKVINITMRIVLFTYVSLFANMSVKYSFYFIIFLTIFLYCYLKSNLILEIFKKEYLENKKKNRRNSFLIVIFIWPTVYFLFGWNEIIFFWMNSILGAFIYVGFEFPDEPPKRKKKAGESLTDRLKKILPGLNPTPN